MTCLKGVDCHADLGHDFVWSQYSTNTTEYFNEFNGGDSVNQGLTVPDI